MKIKPLMILLVLPILLFGCSPTSQSDDIITLEFWTTTGEEETAILQTIVTGFEQENPNVKVNLVPVDYYQASNELKIATLTQDAPDIFRNDITWTAELADLGILLPLDGLISETDLADYLETTLQTNKYKGQIFGVPMVTDAPALLYNKALLEQSGYTDAPKTMEQLMEVAKAVTKNGNYGIYISPSSYYSLSYLWAFGGGMISDELEIQITDPGSVQGIQFMKQLLDEQVAQPYNTFDNWEQTMMDDFKAGKVAMISNGPWATANILSGTAFQDAANLGIAPVPEGPGGEGSPAGGHSLVISKYSKHSEEAYRLIEYVNSTESQIYMAKKANTLPTRKSAYKDEELEKNGIFQGFKAQLEVAKARPIIPESSLLFADFTSNLEKILKGEVSAKIGLADVASSWEYLIK